MSDLVAFGETMLRLSPPGHQRLESASSLELHVGGSESNVAVAADRLGAVATWMSKLPRNPLGRRIVGELHQCGIETDVAWSRTGRVGTYYVETAGEPRGSNVVYDRDSSAITTATPEELNLDRIRDARLFFTSGITPALSPTLRETTMKLLQTARSAGTTTALDLNYREKLWSPKEAQDVLTNLFPGIDVLIIAARDAKAVLGFEGDHRQLAHKLGSQFDFTTVVVTRGSQGALAWHDSVVHDQDAFETETTEPIGAGDAFSGAFLARRLAGDDVQRALEYAAATAALKRTIPGDVARVTMEEVERVVAENGTGGITR
ncbi:bifunctional 2-dehydro-3-deoxygluconokinase/2-dehydro-3-deoxygalactonokinase [Halovivax gelatinilyticus]|uniref:bifunctional 2-dehydro-3-deoxygluconokinase/2-dehydro-3- deoxygalactonokinase n=1 Tax=Halovivax gelatinilyticus TaxID=2961597 RepID=UPI0020CA9975|nr:bifunctional 2-dehydro-3-deoxygluconokinase/2-dehydro-3-deoxygalactonokinase [Halovivax gelatinilyticus]